MKFQGINPNGLNQLSTGSLALYSSGSEVLRVGPGFGTVYGKFTVVEDLTVQGSITAQEFHTELISSSIIFQSGSTKFGDTQDDTHQVTGSLLVAGNLSLNFDSVHNYFNVIVNNEEKLRINEEGVLTLIPQLSPPTPVSGGLYFDLNSNLFVGM